MLLLSSAFVLNQHNTNKINSQTAQAKHDYISIDTSDIVAISQIGQFDQTLKLMKPNSTIILGENMFAHSDIAAKHYWCDAVKNKYINAYIGVEGKDGTGEIWLFNRNVQSPISWLLCFEGFSVFRWLELGLQSPKTVIILSNDKITSPLRTYILRDKLSREFAKLFNLNVFHANMGLRFLQKSH